MGRRRLMLLLVRLFPFLWSGLSAEDILFPWNFAVLDKVFTSLASQIIPWLSYLWYFQPLAAPCVIFPSYRTALLLPWADALIIRLLSAKIENVGWTFSPVRTFQASWPFRERNKIFPNLLWAFRGRRQYFCSPKTPSSLWCYAQKKDLL